MKKIFSALLIGTILSLTSPVSLVLSRDGFAVVENTAFAVACDQGKIKSGQQIKLGVPVISGQECIDNTQPGGAIVAYIKAILQYLSGGVGTVIVLMIVIAGIQYLTAAGNPQLVAKAKSRIFNAILALVLFSMGFAILSFIIPGGILTI